MQNLLSLVHFLILLVVLPCYGQPDIPQPTQFQPIQTASPPSISLPAHQPGNQPIPAFPNTVLTYGSFIPPRQQASVQQVKDILTEVTDERPAIGMRLPLITQRKQLFDQAFTEIRQMLDGAGTPDLKRAVFLTENAFRDGTMSYTVFSSQIARIATVIKAQMEAEHLSVHDPLHINQAVYRFMCDTLTVKLAGETVTTYPKTYDFNDPFGLKDVCQLFVSKLIRTGKGQCKSLPLLFLILVEELQGEAWLSFSPSHSFIKCKDRNGLLCNIELTNGMIVSDSWLVGSGYVKAASVTSGIYLDTMNIRQVIANCLVDLSQYYSWRFGKNDVQMGHDEFNLQCLDLALTVHPTNIHALLGKSDYYTVLLNYTAVRKGYRTEQQLLSDPITAALFRDRNKLYALTDQLGYEYLGEADYLQWLQTEDPSAVNQPSMTH